MGPRQPARGERNLRAVVDRQGQQGLPATRRRGDRGREREVTEIIAAGEVRDRVLAGKVIGAAIRTYRERFWRVAGTAFVVFGIVAAVDAFATVLVIDRHVSRPFGAAITSAASAVFAMAGVVVYAGILDKVVGAHLHGHPDLTISEIRRVLPLRRLAAADVVLAVVTLAGLAVFVVPGVVA